MLIKCPECRREISDTAPSCPGCGYVPNVVQVPAKPREHSTETQMLLVEQRITNEGPSAGVAYLLWFFLGLFGGHRFYLGKGGSAVVMLILTFSIVGVFFAGIWWVIDAFLIPDMLREKRAQLRAQYTALMVSWDDEEPSKEPWEF
jgi:TM2 domain-containing membrane protein YozV